MAADGGAVVLGCGEAEGARTNSSSSLISLILDAGGGTAVRSCGEKADGARTSVAFNTVKRREAMLLRSDFKLLS